VLRLLVALVALALAGTARAQCAPPATATARFADSTSYDLRGGTIATAQSETQLSCSGTVVNLLTTNRATATTSSANGFRLRSAAGDTVAYRLSADEGGSFPFTQGGSVDYYNPQLLQLLGLFGSNRFAARMYAALTEAPNLPAGTYTDTVTVTWSWDICQVGVATCVVSSRGSGRTTVLTVSLTVTPDCRISAPAVSFGAAPLLAQFRPVRQAVAVDCTRGTNYSISFDAGGSGASRPWRAMRGPGGATLRYNLYRADGTTIWDAQTATQRTAGTGATVPGQLHDYVARIDPDQPAPAAGSYSDTVSVVVSF
jgi:spore coat protein U-like protein